MFKRIFTQCTMFSKNIYSRSDNSWNMIINYQQQLYLSAPLANKIFSALPWLFYFHFLPTINIFILCMICPTSQKFCIHSAYKFNFIRRAYVSGSFERLLAKYMFRWKRVTQFSQASSCNIILFYIFFILWENKKRRKVKMYRAHIVCEVEDCYRDEGCHVIRYLVV